MARISTLALRATLIPQHPVGAYGVSLDYSISATEADNGDRITLFEFQRAGYLSLAEFALAGTLGASATAKLQYSNAADDAHTDLTGATTAGGEDRERCTRGIRVEEGGMISLLIGGADISAATTCQLEMLISHNPVLLAVSLA